MDKTSNVSFMALAYLQAGLSVIPTRNDKRPTLESWSDFQKSLPSEQQVKTWFSNGTRNIALINGAVSGNRETLDFDCDMEALPAWEKIVQEEAPE
ncbi:MAG: bifunctional DNA primase/polymerase [Deltaproteobacteria bacterium]|nr:bifunctional DNA primase/polymerase [Deltaproteobacteria bacterium]